jgi:hypothetical protein
LLNCPTSDELELVATAVWALVCIADRKTKDA